MVNAKTGPTSGPLEDPRTSWIYALTKEKLAEALTEHRLPTDGSFSELRARLVKYWHEQAAGGTEQYEEPEEQFTSDPPTPRPRRWSEALPPRTNHLEIIRKWGCHFNGQGGLAFLERIEDLRVTYGLEPEQLRQGLALFFQGDALAWYRNYRETWKSWDDFEDCFRQFYVPASSQFEVEAEIARRVQGPKETARQYATAIQTLMRQLERTSSQTQLERIYYNLRPDYKMYVRRSDFTDLAGLLRMADEFEKLRSAEQTATRGSNTRSDERPKRSGTALVSEGYDHRHCCWNCGQRGHRRQNCRRPQKKFCSRCGKEGILTRDCHGAGNADSTEAMRGGTPSIDRKSVV